MADHALYTTQIKPKRVWNFSTIEDTSRFIALVEKHPELLARISQERLLSKWQPLVRVTGVSATDMAMKWKRLCDRYRAELRREIMSKPFEFKSTWFHYEAMSFARPVEEKRIRLNRNTQTNQTNQTNSTINVECIKIEPVTPPSSPIKPPVPVVSSPVKAKPSHSMVITSPILLDRPVPKQFKTLIPIESMLHEQKAPAGCRMQDIKEDLQLQAGRVVASRSQPVHRLPIPNVTVTNIRNAPDNDYDFLMIRIYPMLSIMPLHLKRFCYENMQHFLFNQYRDFVQTRRGNLSRPGNHTLYNP